MLPMLLHADGRDRRKLQQPAAVGYPSLTGRSFCDTLHSVPNLDFISLFPLWRQVWNRRFGSWQEKISAGYCRSCKMWCAEWAQAMFNLSKQNSLQQQWERQDFLACLPLDFNNPLGNLSVFACNVLIKTFLGRCFERTEKGTKKGQK